MTFMRFSTSLEKPDMSSTNPLATSPGTCSPAEQDWHQSGGTIEAVDRSANSILWTESATKKSVWAQAFVTVS
jgi:hypothetical protein